MFIELAFAVIVLATGSLIAVKLLTDPLKKALDRLQVATEDLADAAAAKKTTTSTPTTKD